MRAKPGVNIDDTLPGINAYYQAGIVHVSYKATMALAPQQLKALIQHEHGHHYQYHAEIFAGWLILWAIVILVTPAVFGLEWAGPFFLLWLCTNWMLETLVEICADLAAPARDMLDVLEIIGTDSFQIRIRKQILKWRQA